MKSKRQRNTKVQKPITLARDGSSLDKPLFGIWSLSGAWSLGF